MAAGAIDRQFQTRPTVYILNARLLSLRCGRKPP